MKSRLFLFTVLIFALSVITMISSAQRRPETADKPISGDFKITIKTTVAGQDMQSTTMIKGLRERSETSIGGNMGGMSVGMMTTTHLSLQPVIPVNDRAPN